MEKAKTIPAGSAGFAPKPEVILYRLLEANMNLLMGKCVNDANIEEEVESRNRRGAEGPEWHWDSKRKNVDLWKKKIME